MSMALSNTPRAERNMEAGEDLLLRVRGAFIAQRTTLTQWARKLGHDPANVRKCLLGRWNGPRALTLRSEILNACGLAHQSREAS